MSSPEAVAEWLNSALDKITNEKFKDCVKVTVIEIKPLTDQLIVIVSDIFRLKVKLEYKNGNTAELKGVYKMEPTNPGFADLVKETGICDAELLIYGKILRWMEELISSRDEKKEIPWPECYYCGENRFFLQDLCEEGYKVVPTHEMLDAKHATLALKLLGKYHAMSLVLTDQGILDKKIVPINLLTKKLPFLNSFYSGNTIRLADVIEQSWDQEWKPFAAKLRNCVENVDDKLAHMVLSTQGKCSVLIHGDYTIRNMLFKYDEKCPDTPIDVKAIDFQGASWSNLSLDVVNLIYSSVKPKTREENLDEFLKTYWESLSHWCSYFGYKGSEISLDDIRKGHDDFKLWGLLVALLIIPAFLGPQNNFIAEAVEEANGDIEEAASKMIQPSVYKVKEVEEALKFQLKASLKRNVI